MENSEYDKYFWKGTERGFNFIVYKLNLFH